jgi:hypothetical protein
MTTTAPADSDATASGASAKGELVVGCHGAWLNSADAATTTRRSVSHGLPL